jgi:AraC family transcriptional regulator
VVEALLFGFADVVTGSGTPAGCLEVSGALACSPASEEGLLVEGVATMLAAHLVCNYDTRSRSSYDPARRLDPAALRLVAEYMHDHIDQHIALDELSNIAGVSRFQFIRLFRASTGLTPMKYLESCRIELARKLIRESNRSMPEIALTVGFADQSYFVKRFRHRAPQASDAECAARLGLQPTDRG